MAGCINTSRNTLPWWALGIILPWILHPHDPSGLRTYISVRVTPLLGITAEMNLRTLGEARALLHLRGHPVPRVDPGGSHVPTRRGSNLDPPSAGDPRGLSPSPNHKDTGGGNSYPRFLLTKIYSPRSRHAPRGK